MNILIVTHYFWPENFKINDIAEYLSLKGHNVTVLTGVPNYPKGVVFSDYKKNKSKYAKYKHCNIIRVPIFTRGKSKVSLLLNYISFVFSASLFGLFKTFRLNYDLIFVYEPSPITVALPAIFMNIFKKKKIILWVLDIWPETPKSLGIIKSPALIKLLTLLVGFIYKKCDLILTQSKGFEKKIKEISPNSLTKYFPSWADEIVDLNKIKKTPSIDFNESVFNVMFTGNIGEAQDLESVILAANNLRHYETIRWIFVGDGRNFWKIKELVMRYKLENSVIFTGFVESSKLDSYIAHANLLLVSLRSNPLYSITIPAKVQNYLSKGLPIVGLLDGEGAEIIKSANAGYVCKSGEFQCLAKTVLEFKNMSESTRKKIGMNGQNIAISDFSRKKLLNELIRSFESIVK